MPILKLILTSLSQAAMLVFGQLLLKDGMNKMHNFVWNWDCLIHQFFMNWAMQVAILLIVAGNVLWLYMLKVYPFSIIYPLTSIGFVLGMLGGMWFLGETVVWTQWMGVLLIMGGCWFIIR